MALPIAGTILLSTVKAYFGEATPPNTLTSYNRGGTYVPDISQNSNIPTSASAGNPIKLSQFRGSSDPETITYTPGSANNVVTPQYQTTATFLIWGGGGGGGYKDIGAGGGAGGGAFLIKTINITGGTTTFNYVVGTGGLGGVNAPSENGQTAQPSSVTINSITYTANGGIGGLGNGGSGAGGTTSGNGDAGSEVGGNGANAGGGGGNAGGQSYGGGQGGTIAGVTQPTPPGGGGDGGGGFDLGQDGADGIISVEYS
jgi:hypothetical protein